MTSRDLGLSEAQLHLRRHHRMERLRERMRHSFEALERQRQRAMDRAVKRAKTARAQIVDEDNAWCHPSNAVRTKCACGQVFSLGRTLMGGSTPTITCACGRQHRKAPGGWHGANNGGRRGGGSRGCPGFQP